MNKEEAIELAKRVIKHGWDFETFYYGDDMNGREDESDIVWEYVEECREIGTIAFYDKYGK